MFEQLLELPLSWWLGIGSATLGSVALVLWVAKRGKKLKPTPRPNRVPYDKDRFRK